MMPHLFCNQNLFILYKILIFFIGNSTEAISVKIEQFGWLRVPVSEFLAAGITKTISPSNNWVSDAEYCKKESTCKILCRDDQEKIFFSNLEKSADEYQDLNGLETYECFTTHPGNLLKLCCCFFVYTLLFECFDLNVS